MTRLVRLCALVALHLAIPSATAGAQESAASLTPEPLRGRSGKLKLRTVSPERGGPIRILQQLFGDTVAVRPGIYTTQVEQQSVSFASLVPFTAKLGGRIGRYLIGTWPRERGGNPDLPDGFIEVTAQNQDTPVSEHFRLKDFLTHDQQNVWPKYLALRETLVDKLELVIEDLTQRGYRVRRMSVMSGFRTPQYNAQGVRPGGRARDSRHQYGDAADIFVDNDGNGVMDDLNRDGVVNKLDATIVLQSVERVERRHPNLSGGASLYGASSTHGPFLHVDVRGSRVRWGASTTGGD